MLNSEYLLRYSNKIELVDLRNVPIITILQNNVTITNISDSLPPIPASIDIVWRNHVTATLCITTAQKGNLGDWFPLSLVSSAGQNQAGTARPLEDRMVADPSLSSATYFAVLPVEINAAKEKIHSSAATHIKYWIFTPFVSGCVQPASGEILPATSFERDVVADKIPLRSTDVTRTINYDDDDDERRPTLLETKTRSWSWTWKSWTKWIIYDGRSKSS